MSEPKTIGVTWLTDRYDDDVAYELQDATNNLVSSAISVLGYNKLDETIITNENVLFNNSIIKTRLGVNSTLSFGATIALLANRFQPFIIPPDIIEYINSEISSEDKFNTHLYNLPIAETFLIKGKYLLKQLLDIGFPSQAAYALAGNIWCHCKWNPNKYNVNEQKGLSLAKYKNWSGCTEGLFGINTWNKKKILIEQLELDKYTVEMYKWDNYNIDKTSTFMGTVLKDEYKYNEGPYPSIKNSSSHGCLFQIKEDYWLKILMEFINRLPVFSGDDDSVKTMLMYDKKPMNNNKNDDDDHKLLYASYTYSLDHEISNTFDSVVKATSEYKNSINVFVEQLLAAYLLSQYCIGVNINSISLDYIFNDKYGSTTGIIKSLKSIGDDLFGSLFDYNDYELDGTWWNCVEQMGKWYQTNVHTYQGSHGALDKKTGRQSYFCPLINQNVQDDCSSFVRACTQLFGLKPNEISTAYMQEGSNWDKLLRSNGFIHMEYSPEKVKQGDIICGEANTHTEIYAGNGKSYAWGSIHDGMNGHVGMPCYFCKTTKYKHIWRYVG